MMNKSVRAKHSAHKRKKRHVRHYTPSFIKKVMNEIVRYNNKHGRGGAMRSAEKHKIPLGTIYRWNKLIQKAA